MLKRLLEILKKKDHSSNELTFTNVEQNTQAAGKVVSVMDSARWSGRSSRFMMVIGALDMHKARVNSSILMAVYMMETGVIIKSMDMEYSSMQLGANIQAIGEMTYSTVKGSRRGLMALSLLAIILKV